MIVRNQRARRMARTAARAGCLGSGAMLAISAWGLSATGIPHAAAAGVDAGTVQVISMDSAGTPGTSRTSGGSADTFSLKLPDGAACTGDSANDGYRVQTYMVPESVNPSSLQFDNQGPMPNGTGANLRQPLFDTTQAPYIDGQTASADAPPGPGRIVAIPGFNFSVYTSGQLPAGAYNVGIACTKGAASATQLDRFWNVKMTFVASGSDPVGVTWTAPAAAPQSNATTTTTTSSSTTSTSSTSTTSSSTTSSTSTTSTTVADDEDVSFDSELADSSIVAALGETLSLTPATPCPPPEEAESPMAVAGVVDGTGDAWVLSAGSIDEAGEWVIDLPLGELEAGTYSIVAGCFDEETELEDWADDESFSAATLAAAAAAAPVPYHLYEPAELIIQAEDANETVAPTDVPTGAAPGGTDVGAALTSLPVTGSSTTLAIWAALCLALGRAAILLGRPTRVIAMEVAR